MRDVSRRKRKGEKWKVKGKNSSLSVFSFDNAKQGNNRANTPVRPYKNDKKTPAVGADRCVCPTKQQQGNNKGECKPRCCHPDTL